MRVEGAPGTSLRRVLFGLLAVVVPTVSACTARSAASHSGDVVSTGHAVSSQVVEVWNGGEILCGSTETARILAGMGFRATAFGNDFPAVATTIEYPPSQVGLASRLHAVVPQARMKAADVRAVRLVLGENRVTVKGLDFAAVKPTCDAARIPPQ